MAGDQGSPARARRKQVEDADSQAEPSATLAQVELLQSSRAHRDEHGELFIEGVRNLVCAFDAGWRFRRVIHCRQLLRSAEARSRVRALQERGVPLVALSPEAFRRVSRTERASGVAAILEQRWDKLHGCGSRGCFVVLSSIRSPGNLGTLLRSALAFGATGVILIGPAIDPFEPGVVRASMGALFGQRLVRTGLRSLRQWALRRRAMVVGASPQAQTEFQSVRYARPTLLLLGDERKGLDAAQRSLCQYEVRIPMVGAVDSLNVAVAGSMLLWAARSGPPG